MSETAITEELIRQTDPAVLQRALIDELERGVNVFRVKPAGVTWSEWSDRNFGLGAWMQRP